MDNNKPRTITCNLLRYEDKVKILQKASKPRGINIFENEDFDRETMELRKEFGKDVKAHRHTGRISYLSYRTVVEQKEGNFEQ